MERNLFSSLSFFFFPFLFSLFFSIFSFFLSFFFFFNFPFLLFSHLLLFDPLYLSEFHIIRHHCLCQPRDSFSKKNAD